jgi:selenocysteine-specific elongation factor
METIAEVVLHGIKRVAPGTEVWARLKFAEPTLLLPGDHFTIRQFSPVVTIGGGVVLDAAPVSRDLPDDKILQILAAGDRKAILRVRIWRHYDDGASLPDLVAETGWTKDTIEHELAEPLKAREIVRINDTFLIRDAWETLDRQVVSSLEQFHQNNPLVEGMSKKELQIRTDASNEAVFEAILRALIAERKIEIAGDLVRLPGHGVRMKDEEAESKKRIEEVFASAGLRVPALHEVIAGLTVDKDRAQKIITLLLRDKVLVKVSQELVFHRTALEELRRQMAIEKTKSPRIDVARFKALTGISRKYAIPLLEYLDRERVTRRVGDVREIL